MDLHDFDLDVQDPSHVPLILRGAAHWYSALADTANKAGNLTLARKWESMGNLLYATSERAQDIIARNIPGT
jgi:hypothetical protein